MPDRTFVSRITSVHLPAGNHHVAVNFCIFRGITTADVAVVSLQCAVHSLLQRSGIRPGHEWRWSRRWHHHTRLHPIRSHPHWRNAHLHLRWVSRHPTRRWWRKSGSTATRRASLREAHRWWWWWWHGAELTLHRVGLIDGHSHRRRCDDGVLHSETGRRDLGCHRSSELPCWESGTRKGSIRYAVSG